MASKFVAAIRRLGQAFSAGDTHTWTSPAADAPAMSLGRFVDAAMEGSLTVTRENALTVPAVLRGRNMVCNVSTLPLVQLDTQRRPIRSPLLDQINPDVPNVVTLAQTVEDLQFDGIAWWRVLSRGWNLFPVSAEHVDARRVSLVPPTGYQNPLPSGIDPASVVWVDGEPVDGRSMIRFDSPNPPLMTAGARAIRRAILTEMTAEMYARDPKPLDFFTPSDSMGSLDDDEVQDVLDSWASARRRRKTAYVPETLTYNSVQSPNPADLQLVQLQQRATLDLANAIGVDPEDLGVSTTSRTYQNATDRRQDRVNDVLSGFMRAITDRLSMNDVTRRGYRVVFDLDDYMRADPATRWSVYETAHRIGVLDLAEIREREDLPDVPTPDVAPAPTEDNPAPADVSRETSSDVSRETSSDVSRETPQEDSVSARRHAQHVTFSASAPRAARFTFSGHDGATFSVDPERRIIKGTALLYGVAADNGTGVWTFADGSVSWKRSAVNRVKLLRDHDWSALLGSALALRVVDGRLDAEFKVARGAAGDQALMEAEDGALDGLSVGVDILAAEPTDDDGAYTVTSATLREISLTPIPAFDDARITSVAASHTNRGSMRCTKCGIDHGPDVTCETATAEDNKISPPIDYDAMAAAFARAMRSGMPGADAVTAPEPAPEVVNPASRPAPGARGAAAFVREPAPYRRDRAGNFTLGEHDFSTDIVAMLKSGDANGTGTPEGKRVMAQLSQAFAVETTNVDELNPAINRPDMYVDQRPYRTPLWDIVSKGAPPNGVQPFGFPKFDSASGLVSDHTEGTEPSSGTFTTTSQTITPTAVSGKASITREVWDMGGNPAISTLIYNKMVSSYWESLEGAVGTFLDTLTTATTIPLTGATGAETGAQFEAAIASLVFERGYDWSAFATSQDLYTALTGAVDGDGRPLYPQIAPSNANGATGVRFRTLSVGGVSSTPAWALDEVSYLIDPSTVHAWATGPQRLEFSGTSATGGYAPVAMIDLAVWGYKALANSDLGGVRRITYTPATGGGGGTDPGDD